MFVAKNYGKRAKLLAKDPIPGHIREKDGIE